MINKEDRILITGATGFLGKSLYRKLEENEYNNVIKLGHGVRKSDEVELLDYGDTLSVLEKYEPKCVIHLAGIVGGIGANRNNPGRFIFENLQMGINVIECSRLVDVEKIIMIGTVCMYGCHSPVPFSEKNVFLDEPEITNSYYGWAKRVLIKMCEAYNRQYGMKNISLLPVNLVGPGEHFDLENSHVIPSLIMKFDQAIKSGENKVVIWGTGSASREFLYVDDCALGIIKTLSCDTHEGPINLGTGKEIKIRNLVTLIGGLMGYKGDIVYDTSKPDGQPRRCLDVSLAKQVLGWEATTSLRDGLENTIQYYKELKC